MDNWLSSMGLLLCYYRQDIIALSTSKISIFNLMFIFWKPIKNHQHCVRNNTQIMIIISLWMLLPKIWSLTLQRSFLSSASQK